MTISIIEYNIRRAFIAMSFDTDFALKQRSFNLVGGVQHTGTSLCAADISQLSTSSWRYVFYYKMKGKVARVWDCFFVWISSCVTSLGGITFVLGKCNSYCLWRSMSRVADRQTDTLRDIHEMKLKAAKEHCYGSSTVAEAHHFVYYGIEKAQ